MLWSNKVIDKFPDKVLKKWLILAALECPVFTDIEFVDLNLPWGKAFGSKVIVGGNGLVH